MADPADHVRIFSGDYSRDMWAKVNAITDPEALEAVYFVCCRLQEFEARFERLAKQHGEPRG